MKAWIKEIKIIAFFAAPIVLAGIIIFGNLSPQHQGYSLLGTLVLAIIWYLVYLLRTNDNELKALRHYFFFLLKELPSILQILTFAGFVTFFYRSEIKAANAISLLTTTLICLYLTFSWRDYLQKADINKSEIEKLDKDFRLFTLILFFILWLILLKATTLLLV